MILSETIKLKPETETILISIDIGMYLVYFNFDNNWSIENYSDIIIKRPDGSESLTSIKPGSCYEVTSLIGSRLEEIIICVNCCVSISISGGYVIELKARNQGFESILLRAGEVNVTLF